MGIMSVLFHHDFFDHVLEIFWSEKYTVLLNCFRFDTYMFFLNPLVNSVYHKWMLYFHFLFFFRKYHKILYSSETTNIYKFFCLEFLIVWQLFWETKR